MWPPVQLHYFNLISLSSSELSCWCCIHTILNILLGGINITIIKITIGTVKEIFGHLNNFLAVNITCINRGVCYLDNMDLLVSKFINTP